MLLVICVWCCCLFVVVRCLWFVVGLGVGGWSLLVACCLLLWSVVVMCGCSLVVVVVRCVVFVVCCLFFARCVLCVVCC